MQWTLKPISCVSRERQEEREKPWDGLTQYFGVNDRFHPPACSKPPPKVTKAPACLPTYLLSFNTVSVVALNNTFTSFVFPRHCILSLFYVI